MSIEQNSLYANNLSCACHKPYLETPLKSNSNEPTESLASIDELDFEIINDYPMTDAEILLQDFKNLPEIIQFKIKNKITQVTEEALENFIKDFQDRTKTFATKLKIVNTATPIALFLYTGPLSAIFSSIVLGIAETGWIAKKLLDTLQYFPKEDIMVNVLIKEMRDHLSAIADKTFLEFAYQRPANLDEAKKLYRQLSLKYHPDRNQDADASEKFQRIEYAYDLFKRYRFE